VDSAWLFCVFIAGIGLGFAASFGLFFHAKRRKKAKLETLILGALTLLIGSFWIYLLALFL
jgi:hypothetical protein